ncbi:MAG: hypothetical protein UV17_C0062G0006 [Candidatus Gottesmanbacteria bacterium GW2011_GWA1_42_26]|nr:MAG: hypothetical protein UV17_C0062G0006 [Candidatus Gottesmanbacteria bacterium GW2011_GWA1_42_26]
MKNVNISAKGGSAFGRKNQNNSTTYALEIVWRSQILLRRTSPSDRNDNLNNKSFRKPCLNIVR